MSIGNGDVIGTRISVIQVKSSRENQFHWSNPANIAVKDGVGHALQVLSE
jgi:hypothetical protein